MSRRTVPAQPATRHLPEVTTSEGGGIRHLHLGSPWVQGSMRIKKPFDIELEYVQRMMAWLLFMAPDSVARRHAMQLGLGAGALTKFCHHHLRMTTAAIELNPQVVAACRLWFKMPPDDSRLSVILGDAAEVAASDHWAAQIDALQVDLYDEEAAAPLLDDQGFYADCRHLLTDDGVLTLNVFGNQSSEGESIARLVDTFGAGCVWRFAPTREGNVVLLATRSPMTLAREVLAQRADEIARRWPLPATRWIKSLQRVEAP